MHIRSKFDGGKQINRSQAGGWQGRCAGAGLRQNLAGDWGPQTWKVITNKEPNKVFKDVSTHRAEQIVKDRKRKAGDAAKESRWKSKRLKTNDDSIHAQQDYSQFNGQHRVLDVASDIPQDFLEDIMIQYYLANIKVDDLKAAKIESLTQGQGDETSSVIWLVERRLRITSSVVGEIAKRRPTTQVKNQVKKNVVLNI